jgi:hypothetical protein
MSASWLPICSVVRKVPLFKLSDDTLSQGSQTTCAPASPMTWPIGWPLSPRDRRIASPVRHFLWYSIIVLAEKRHLFRDQLVSPNIPKGLFILSGGFSNGCAFPASTTLSTREKASTPS